MRTIRMSLSRRKPFCGRSTSGLALRRIRLRTTRLRSGLHGPMTEAVADMLRAYREVPTAQLALSGYLDIKGNVWGAIVRDGRGWVDMVTVAADAGDASCRLRAVRLVPQTISSKEGS